MLDELVTKDICIEVCPISNRLTGAVPPDEAHPLLEFRRFGVPFVICSDNPGIHQHGLADDHATAMAEGLTARDLNQQYKVAKRYSFIRDLD
ncbi:adenosine deaminase (add) [Stutzerimonas degradans]|nr:adenosine deaminase (add) [Stutzerimonas degradans]EKM95449.1 adenosine deaminase (add) [Stutzerimonas degradans]